MFRRLFHLLFLLFAIAVAIGTAIAEDRTPVAKSILPPGAPVPDLGPSTAIFPPQTLTIRFDHKLHVEGQHVGCATCHPNALTSRSSADLLTPKATTCDACHEADHSNPSAVVAKDCASCHLGYKPEDGNRVAAFRIPTPNLTFDHKRHADRNIGCRQCHGDVEEIGLATRDQLPRMKGCFDCHSHPGREGDLASRGEAKNACETCHLRGGSGPTGNVIRTSFPTGTLNPPRWMHNAKHEPDFLQRHKYVAANDSQFCGNCHKEDFCVACHDGRVRPRSIHPSDYLNLHATEARLATQKCQSCHREQSFCLGCHQRMGVSMSGPSAVREAGRFHPPKAEWSDAPRKPGHHAFEAMRNLNACVSCHIERDCVVCHGGQGVGGGFNPHSGGFVSGCATQMRRNPRPCYVCHEPGAAVLRRCQ